LVKWDDLALKRVGHSPRALEGAVGHQNRSRTLLNQMPRGQLAHLARADQKNRAALERSEDFAGQFHSD